MKLYRLTKADKIVLKHNIEALLFASGKYLNIKFIADLCNAPISDTKKQLTELQKEYKEKPVLTIINSNDDWKMTVKEQYSDIVSKIVSNVELGKTTIETLSLIAYNNPALQSDIIKNRGQTAYEHIAELVKKGFIIKERIGRSFILKLSEKFFEYFEIDGKKIKEVFQPVKDRVDEQIYEINNKTTKPKKKQKDTKLFNGLEVVDIQDKEKINNVRDKHKDFLESFDEKIENISKKVEEQDINNIKNSDVQKKIEELKSENTDSLDIEKINQEIDEISKKNAS